MAARAVGRPADQINYHTRQNSAYRSGRDKNSAAFFVCAFFIRQTMLYFSTKRRISFFGGDGEMAEKKPQTQQKQRGMPGVYAAVVHKPEKNPVQEKDDRIRLGRMLRQLMEDR